MLHKLHEKLIFNKLSEFKGIVQGVSKIMHDSEIILLGAYIYFVSFIMILGTLKYDTKIETGDSADL